jgi:polysaccharide biosynthesis transport protein
MLEVQPQRIIGRSDQPTERYRPSGVQHEDAVRGLLSVLRRRIIVATVVFVAIFGAAIVPISRLEKRYSATSIIALDVGRRDVSPVSSVAPQLPADSGVLAAEVQTLLSPQLADRVMSKLDLLDRFSTSVTTKNSFSRLLSGLLSSAASASKAQRTPNDPIDRFLRQLRVTAIPRTYTIQVTFSDPSPVAAAAIANAIVDQYLAMQIEVKTRATEQAGAWLAQQLSSLHDTMRDSERELQEYIRKANLGGEQGTSVEAQQQTQINAQLVVVRSERAAAEARVRRMEQMLAAGDIESITEVLSSPLIQRLREQEAELQREEGELAERYGERHPTILNIRAEIQDLRAVIASEISKIVKAAQSDANETRIREQSLERALNDVQGELNDRVGDYSYLAELQREAAVNRNLYEAFLTRLNETRAQTHMQQADARVVSFARAPINPSFPPTRILTGLAFLASMMISGLLILVIERLDRRLVSTHQVEVISGISGIGITPRIPGRKYRADPCLYLRDKPASVYAESVRSALTLIQAAPDAPKSILVTSPLPGDGKTTLSVSLACVAARSRQRVVLVDCDVRRSRARHLFKMGSGAGLLDYLNGEADIEDIVNVMEEGPSIIVGSSSAPMRGGDGAYLINGPRLKRLLQRLSETYDVVVIDSPPVLAVSDAIHLSKIVDTTLLAVRWGITTRDSMALTVDLLNQAGSDIAGVVITAVDLKKHAQLGFHDRGHYYAEVRGYYLEK